MNEVPAAKIGERSDPRVSIIIATYNASETLDRCVSSILGQTFTGWELLIVDGASADCTVDIIRRHEDRISYWHSHADLGIYDAWNQAIPHARGEYVTFLGADDALDSPETLHRIFCAIQGNAYDLVTSRARLRDRDWNPLQQVGRRWDYSMLPRKMLISHPGLLHRRELFQRYGTFDSSLRIVSDLEFLLRLPRDTRALDLPWVTVDVQSDGISRRQFWRRIRERRQVHLRCGRVGPARAWFYWANKALRMPIAKLLGLPY